MNPPKNKVWDSCAESRPCFAGDSFRPLLEPAMNKLLVAVLITACTVNMACLLSHLHAVAPDEERGLSLAQGITTLSNRSAVVSQRFL
jgi:hypothetical protein